MSKTIMRFMACSDLHFKDDPACAEKQRFDAGLRQLYAYADKQEYKKVDAVYIVGDFADGGSRQQMLNVKDSLTKGIRPETVVNLALASHEWGGEGREEGARARFDEIFGQPADTHRVINGFHFVSVSCTQGCSFRQPQQEFVARELEAAHRATPKKPVFFFQHPHPSDTVYGSIDWGCDHLMPILVNYPQIITFSGHSHAPVNDPRSIHQEHFTSVGTGTFSYFELDEFDKLYSTYPPESEKSLAAQMQIVEAHDDGSVRILPWDVLTDGPFPELQEGWTIEKPWDPDTFVYTKEKRWRCDCKPYFPADAKLEAEIGDGALRLTFDHAKCDKEPVNDYIITIRDKNGDVERRFTIWAPYYLSKRPERMIWAIPVRPAPAELDWFTDRNCPKVTSLAAGAYTVEIRARGFWHNPSENSLTAQFTF